MKMSFDFRKKSLNNRRREYAQHDWESMDEEYWEDSEQTDEYGMGEMNDSEEESPDFDADSYVAELLQEEEERYEEGSGVEGEYYEDQYYEDGQGEEYYEDGSEEYGEEEYYTDNQGEEYYEDTRDDEYYEEEYYEEDTEEYLEEQSQEYYEANDDEYYSEEGEEYYEEDYEEYMGEDAEEYYQRDGYPIEDLEEEDGEVSKEKNLPIGKWMDYLIVFAAVAMIVIAVVLGGKYLLKDKKGGDTEPIQQVGNQLADIEIIGEDGLMAMSDAQKELLALSQLPQVTEAPPVEETDEPQYEEEEYRIDVDVKLSLTSIEKDLKIKFLNRDTGKLVGNVPFGIEVTDADGKTSFWSDDDMDGIIYKKNLTAGKYTVKVQEPEGERYKSYGFPTGEEKVEVKSKLVYEKVDVVAEIKTESQVDVNKEDTKNNNTIKEEYMQDTVTWVESTMVAESFEEIGQNAIPNPFTLVMAGNFARLSVDNGEIEAPTETTTEAPAETPVAAPVETPTVAPTVAPTEAPTTVPTEIPTVAPTETPTVAPTETPTVAPTETPTVAPTETPTVAPTETPTVAPTETPTAAPTETPTAAPTGTPTAAPTGTPTVAPTGTPTVAPTGSPAPSESPSPEPTEAPKIEKVELEKKTLAVYIGADNAVELAIKVTPDDLKDVVLKAESSDTSVAKAEIKNGKLVITGLKEGKNVSITVSAKIGESTQKVACTIEVKSSPKNDMQTLLKDNQGREVFVLENNAYRNAYYADYFTFSKFYIKKDAKYTGWQTLSGKVMYFDATGKFVTGQQVIQGVKYQFASDGSLVTGTGTMGIDVSKWNGNIDWNAVKNSGASYVIIRCGYRGSSKGDLIVDSKFKENIKGANAVGLKVGVYFFTQAVDKNEALEEASMVLELIKDYKISYPVFLDVEPSGGRADKLDVATRTEICKTFCETIRQYGYTAGIYANKNWLESKLDMNILGVYKVWLAQYASEPTYQGRYDMWQYKDTGKLSGVSGNVDLNQSYLGY